MSVTAAKALAADGYTNLYDLKGGMRAWEAAGKPLVHRPS
jgi:rhodanese-related sulfurtransferase